jgi:hypothetical protein
MEKGLRDICSQTAYYASDSLRDVYGTITYGTATSFDCYYKTVTNVVETTSGTTWVTNHVLYTETSIEPNWRVWLPGDDETDSSLAREIKAVNKYFDENGSVHHYKVII